MKNKRQSVADMTTTKLLSMDGTQSTQKKLKV
jgi:hypothetical protein